MLFVRAGEWLFGSEPVQLSLEVFREDTLKAIRQTWTSLLLGIVAWAILMVPVSWLLYQLAVPFVRRFSAKEQTNPKAQ